MFAFLCLFDHDGSCRPPPGSHWIGATPGDVGPPALHANGNPFVSTNALMVHGDKGSPREMCARFDNTGCCTLLLFKATRRVWGSVFVCLFSMFVISSNLQIPDLYANNNHLPTSRHFIFTQACSNNSNNNNNNNNNNNCSNNSNNNNNNNKNKNKNNNCGAWKYNLRRALVLKTVKFHKVSLPNDPMICGWGMVHSWSRPAFSAKSNLKKNQKPEIWDLQNHHD